MADASIEDWLRGSFEKAFPGNDFSSVRVLPATDAKFGDFQCNDALKFKKTLGVNNPREIAQKVLDAGGKPDFIEKHKEDIAASLEYTIVDILMKKLRMAVKETGIKHVAVAGGVSANTGLRNAFYDHAKRYGWKIYIPKFSYTTDNAAMIGITGYYKYLSGEFCGIDAPAFSKVTFK